MPVDPVRRKLLVALVAAPAFSILLRPRVAHAEHYPALLCSDCGFGSKKDNCTKCGKWMGGTRFEARLCNNHGFGSKKNDCAHCGKWVGSHHQLAYIGNCCGFGSKKENCVVCGKWAS